MLYNINIAQVVSIKFNNTCYIIFKQFESFYNLDENEFKCMIKDPQGN